LTANQNTGVDEAAGPDVVGVGAADVSKDGQGRR
jgi:hypothetical protein